jgi:outer membrane protein OmpA-like peptidoglycan-associated protein
MARRARGEDATVWIGYADFLTTLAVLFLVLVAGTAAKLKRARSEHARPGYLLGIVVDSATSRAVTRCVAKVGETRWDTTDTRGEFHVVVDSLRESVNVGLSLECVGYDAHSQLRPVAPGDTTRDTIRVSPEKRAVGVVTLPGKELFEKDSFKLRPAAIDSIVSLGLRFKSKLAPNEIVAVQGHTDDQEFPAGAGKDNWILSSERAAAAASVLTNPVFGVSIPECQVAIMGFGPSRPVERVDSADPPDEKARKRERNRRIEFRSLHGPDISGAGCAR